jgi:hypothetical protein
MARSLLILACAATLAAPPTVLADDDPLVGDRPDFTESAVTVAPGRLQLEGGYTFERAGEAELHTIGELLMRIGVGASTEIRVEVGSWLHLDDGASTVDGLADPGLGLKQRFLAGDGAVPELALLAASSVPIGNAEVSTVRPEPSLVAAAGWELDERTALGANLGWAGNFDPDLDERFSSVWLSASLAYAATGRLGLFLETYGFDQEEVDGDATGYVDAGATWLANPDLQFDLRCGRGFSGLDYAWFAGAGVVARF